MDIKTFTDMIEPAAKAQIETIAAHPAFADVKIRIMPDVHAGKGCVCGFTADLGDKVVPSLIGVDIGCGMLTLCLGKIDIDCKKLDDVIRSVVPSGKKVHDKQVTGYGSADCDPRNCSIQWSGTELDYFDRSIGTLGSGNHFIEIDVDDDGNKYLIVHTGSRNFGKKVCDWWQDVAAKTIADDVTDDDLATVLA